MNLSSLCQDLDIRGARQDRIYSFRHRITAAFYLLEATKKRLEPIVTEGRTYVPKPVRISDWDKPLKPPLTMPTWSKEQQNVMTYVEEQLQLSDANKLYEMRPIKHYAHVTGPPGSGKTEEVIHAAFKALYIVSI